MKKSSGSVTHPAGAGRVAAAIGSWEADSPFVGPMRLRAIATLINDGGT